MSEGTLIVSISGIRGIFGDGLDAGVLVKYASAFATWLRRHEANPVVVVGRDARVTGELCAQIVAAALRSCGCSVIDAGLATTPTVEMAVLKEGAAGGIILSASHNPAEWNALKLLNHKGEFLSPEEGREMIGISEGGQFASADYRGIGGMRSNDYLEHHIDCILELDFIDADTIARRRPTVVVDGINSVGGIAIPALLARLGLHDEQIHCINCEPTGLFAHTPEPLPGNLVGTIARVAESGADLGIVVDPDADRLALIADGGEYVSEELTQVIAADFLWGKRSGPFVTNLSSSRAIDDVAKRYGQEVYRSAVGEINVVKKMQEVGAMLGGEGNGGVILPDLHYGRDALVGVAMVLQHLAEAGKPLSQIKHGLPAYHIVKMKADVDGLEPDVVLANVADRYASERISTIDGVKIDFDDGWVHLRKSNTEPIIRVYAEAKTKATAEGIAGRFLSELKSR